MKCLIIGEKSIVAGFFKNALIDNFDTTFSSRKKNSLNYLDLLDLNSIKNFNFSKYDLVINCAFSYNYESSDAVKVNYNHLKNLIEKLNLSNTKLIYISSDQVKYKLVHHHKYDFISYYSKLKSSAESLIRKLSKNYLILRIGKIVDKDFFLFNLKKNKISNIYLDYYLFPISKEFFYKYISLFFKKFKFSHKNITVNFFSYNPKSYFYFYNLISKYSLNLNNINYVKHFKDELIINIDKNDLHICDIIGQDLDTFHHDVENFFIKYYEREF